MSRLSKSKHPAYHLRPNKAVDRSVFIRLLHVLDNYLSLNNHCYIGFGGPFLEDFRLLSSEFPKIRMISVEMDEATFKRQIFHKCASNMTSQLCTFEQFLSSQFPTDCPTITWADYTDFSRSVLLEVSDIARKVVPYSVIRITVNAETPVYEKLDLSKRKPSQLPPKMTNDFKSFLKEFQKSIQIEDVSFSEDLFSWSSFKEDNYPNLLDEIISSVISAACTSPKSYLPLHSVKYSDGTIMLSTTGIICLNDEKEILKKHFRNRFEFLKNDPQFVETIDVPFLTTKERLHLECRVPAKRSTGTKTSKRLAYLIEGDGSTELSKYKMSQYERYHRLYPYFGKLVP